MLQFLFNRNSKFVLVLEAVGLVALIILLFKGRYKNIFFIIYIIEYLFIRSCVVWNWHSGIQLHFKKTLVPTSYILLITNIFLLLNINFLIYFSILALLIIAHVNVILLYLHLRDKGKIEKN